MPWELFLGGFVLLVVVTVIVQSKDAKAKSKATGLPKELFLLHGELNRRIVCPHCQTTGKVLTKPVVQKKGIHGGKATGALLTGGASLLATGLSRKEANTEAHCANCNSTWHF